MARNKMEDLRNHLFAALERLNDEDINPEKMKAEMQRAKSIAELSTALVETAKVEIEFIRAIEADGSSSALFQGIDRPLLNQ
ncbi:MAG TPA: hypothetical protein PLP27_06445 [Crocinitomicaceae bacterium]|nr:hypothetical protein [Crocinitomicaceae bacterium]